MTIRIFFRNNFYYRNEKLIIQLNRFYKKCFILFKFVLFQFDKKNLIENKKQNNKIDIYLKNDTNYIYIIIIKTIIQIIVKNILHFINNNRSLSYRYNDIIENFKIVLQKVYIKNINTKKFTILKIVLFNMPKNLAL